MTTSIGGTTGVTFPDASVQNTAATGFGFKNRIINGAMMIDQRNAGASVTPINSAYTLDRWTAYLMQSGKYTVRQNAGSVTPPNGFTNYLGVTSTSAYSVISTDYFSINQLIEGLNVADLGWGSANASSVTLSFWVYSSLTGTFGGSLFNSAFNRSYPYSYTINSANTWEYKTVTIAGDTSGTWLKTNGIGIGIGFSLGAGSTSSGTANTWGSGYYTQPTGATSVVGTNGATFYITGVQLEKGSTATSFDYRPYGTELALCQRYFYILQDWYVRMYQLSSAPFYGQTLSFPVQMRTTPTPSIVGTPAYSNASGMVAAADLGASSYKIYASATTNGDTRFSASGTSNYVTFSAEL